MRHRRDIQGLRAVAVLAVVLFHFRIPPFSGGFVGVDIFFVISGFLMTALILRDVQCGTFRFGDFFARRFRRIYPALLATVILSFLAGLVLFPPQDFARQSGATPMSLLGLSNLFFWWEAGYFDAQAIRKPLLHSWSLSVEAQFYLLWPVLLVGLAKFRPAVLGTGIALITLVSAAACIWMMRVDPTAAFFLAPFRLFEFGAGGLAALSGPRRPRSRRVREAGGLAALAVLAVTVLVYDGRMPFPGLAALPVVIATAGLIWIGPGTLAARMLSGGGMHHIGEISYSVYLVHWPIVVFASYQYGPELPATVRAVCLASALPASLALYHGVERRFRRPAARGLAAPSFVLVPLMALSLLLPLHSWANNGWAFRGSAGLRALNGIDLEAQKAFVWEVFGPLSGRLSYDTGRRPRVLVIGDSQAADFVNVLSAGGVLARIDLVGRQINTLCNVAYLEGAALESFLTEVNPYSIKDPGLNRVCADMMAQAVSGPAWDDADIVIVGFAWRDASLGVMAASFAQLNARTDAPVFAVGNKTFTASPIEIANRAGDIDGLTELSRDRLRPWTEKTNRVLRNLPDVGFIDALASFCTGDRCRMLDEAGMPVFWDETHFSTWGARYAWRRGEAELTRFLAGWTR